MIEIEAAQEVLIGFAFARVLCCDDARNDFDKLAGTGNRAILKVCVSNDAF